MCSLLRRPRSVGALSSKFFALTDAAGLESRLLVAFSAAISVLLAPSFIYARTNARTPHRRKIFHQVMQCRDCVKSRLRGSQSVPPRGSGWVRSAGISKKPRRIENFTLRTHPLPRGGTDLMPLQLSFDRLSTVGRCEWPGSGLGVDRSLLRTVLIRSF